MPDLDTKDDRLYAIPGSPPNLLHKVPGDAFAPRNIFALNIDYRKGAAYVPDQQYPLGSHLVAG